MAQRSLVWPPAHRQRLCANEFRACSVVLTAVDAFRSVLDGMSNLNVRNAHANVLCLTTRPTTMCSTVQLGSCTVEHLPLHCLCANKLCSSHEKELN